METIYSAKMFIKRFLRRITHAFRISELSLNGWPYESCGRCGTGYRITCDLTDNKWLEINGKPGGCLCLDCMATIAQKKKIQFGLNDIMRLYLFDPKNDMGGCLDIIKSIEREDKKFI